MISVIITEDADGYRSIQSSGHAGYDGSGRDIVCAGVSALLLNTVNAVEAFTGDAFSEEEDPENGGRLCVRFSGPVSEQTKLLMDSLILGLRGIEKNYGSWLSVSIQPEEVE